MNRILFALPVVIAACGEAAAPPAVAPTAGKAVSAAPFAQLAFRQSRDAAASVVSANESRIAVEVAGRLVDLPVAAGAQVAKGALLARIDDADYRLAVARAEAAAQQARARSELAAAQLARARELARQNFLSGDAAEIRATELEIARADLLAAEAQLATVRNQLAKTTVRAPFSGTVRSRSGQVGEIVAPGTVLLTLVDASGIEAVAELPAGDAELIGEAADFRFVAGGAEWPVTPLRRSAVVDPQTRLVEVRFAFAASPPPVGTAGRLRWRDGADSLGAEFFVRRGLAYGVFVIDGERARFLPVAGVQEGRPARVVLPPLTQIVSRGHESLQDGDAVVLAAAAPVTPLPAVAPVAGERR
jgi:RND family efflux transporter MFP subunit